MVALELEEEHHRDPFDLSDYLQLSALRKYSLLLQVLSSSDRHLGWVEIIEGQVWSASAGLSVGEDALARLLFTQHQVLCTTLDCASRPQEIHLPMDNLLLELARREEVKKKRPRLATALLMGASRSEAWGEGDDFNLAFLQGLRAALEKDYPQAEVSFRRACKLRPSDFRARANLAQVLSRA